MAVLNFLAHNWYSLLGVAVIIAGAVVEIIKFLGKPNTQQLAALTEWLKYGVTIAESELGSGTGQLKLRSVYNDAIERFPWVAKYITFERFSTYVDEALEWLNKEIETNPNIKELVTETKEE